MQRSPLQKAATQLGMQELLPRMDHQDQPPPEVNPNCSCIDVPQVCSFHNHRRLPCSTSGE